jgi:hypothetical protein
MLMSRPFMPFEHWLVGFVGGYAAAACSSPNALCLTGQRRVEQERRGERAGHGVCKDGVSLLILTSQVRGEGVRLFKSSRVQVTRHCSGEMLAMANL